MKNYAKLCLLPFVLLLVSCASQTERQFMKGCSAATGGEGDEICSCVYEKMDKEYGEKMLEKMNETGYTPPNFEEKMFRFTAECQKD